MQKYSSNTDFTSTSQHQMACSTHKNSTILGHHSRVNKCKMSIQMPDDTLPTLCIHTQLNI